MLLAVVLARVAWAEDGEEEEFVVGVAGLLPPGDETGINLHASPNWPLPLHLAASLALEGLAPVV